MNTPKRTTADGRAPQPQYGYTNMSRRSSDKMGVRHRPNDIHSPFADKQRRTIENEAPIPPSHKSTQPLLRDKRGTVVANDVSKSSKLKINRSRSSQVAYKSTSQDSNYGDLKPPPAFRQTSVDKTSTSIRNRREVAPDPPGKLTGRPKNSGFQPPQGYVMYRAEGMCDLSNIHNIPDYRGSVYDLLEEFRKQMAISTEETPVSTTKDLDTKVLCKESISADSRRAESSTHRKSFRDTILNEEPANDNLQGAEGKSGSSSQTLIKNRGPNCVTTDSEEELLTQILMSMSLNSTSAEQAVEDESDYANLWDSESGPFGTTFQTNKEVMGSLLRRKGERQLPQDIERRKAWVSSTYSDSTTTTDQSSGLYTFDMDKFRSLQEKAENMDLTLTDFFSDLKHSSSILELSKIFSSTQMLDTNDCKYKCHSTCEDLLTDQCTGPKTEKKAQHEADLWDSKHLRHDADDADSGYSGSGGSAGFTLTKEEICSKITAYNESVGRSSGAMTLPSSENDFFQGYIKVCVCIDKPINMSLSSRPTSIYEITNRLSELSPQTSPKNTITHEQLPHNAIVSLHTNSSNMASEVVSILLNKFKITDNPKSFALFEQTIQNEKEVKLRKVGDQERPLLNYLRWSTECNESKRFVLKENDPGDIMYEAFSIPELNNFLRVLEQEEAVKLTEIQNKYQVRRKQLADRLNELDLQRTPNRISLKDKR